MSSTTFEVEMKVFLSWSGDLSHKVACVLRDWLPSVVQAIRPYVSSEDIDKGTRWSTDISKELEESKFGILCITGSNLEAPWINFEAGALSKTIEKTNVAPFLFEIKRSEVQGPLLQFQSTVYEKDDVYKLMVSINTRLPEHDRLDEVPLRKSFEVWWPQLEVQLSALVQSGKSEKPAKQSKTDQQAAILEELLELARTQQKLLRSPNELLPPEYIEFALRHARHGLPELDELRHYVMSVHADITELERRLVLAKESGDAAVLEDAIRMVEQLHGSFHRIERASGIRGRFHRQSEKRVRLGALPNES